MSEAALHQRLAAPDLPPSVLAFVDGVLTLVLAALVTATPVLAHTVEPNFGILAAVALGGLCAWRMPQVAVVVVLFALLFQNLFVSLAADTITSTEEFNVVRGYNFILLAVTWLVSAGRFALEWPDRNKSLDPFVYASLAVFVLVGVLFLVGFARFGMSAIVYLRNIVTPMFLFHVALVTFSRGPVHIGRALNMIAVLLAACGFTEFFFRNAWLTATNGYAFWARSIQPNWQTLRLDQIAKETGRVTVSLLDSFVITLFNSPLLADLGIVVMRMYGPNMHAISFAYALAFFALFSLYRGRVLTTLVLFVLLCLASAKGPLLVFVMVGLAWCVSRVFGCRFAYLLLAALLVPYAAGGIVLGLQIGDFHVLGLSSGVYEFLANPIGQGIGAGGNLSSEFAKIDWPAAQGLGRTPFPVESSVGVLLYQMGVFSFVLIGVYVWISWRVLRIAEATGNSLHAAAAFALLAMVVSGLFQEEAYFSPLALGLYMLLCGMVVGASARTGLLRSTLGEKASSNIA